MCFLLSFTNVSGFPYTKLGYFMKKLRVRVSKAYILVGMFDVSPCKISAYGANITVLGCDEGNSEWFYPVLSEAHRRNHVRI